MTELAKREPPVSKSTGIEWSGSVDKAAIEHLDRSIKVIYLRTAHASPGLVLMGQFEPPTQVELLVRALVVVKSSFSFQMRRGRFKGLRGFRGLWRAWSELAPGGSSTRTASARPQRAALVTAVIPEGSAALASAPASMRACARGAGGGQKRRSTCVQL
eukprot:2065460-Pyramimonas_sp.AAC.1